MGPNEMADRVARIRQQMAEAARASGRTAEAVLLCAACKSRSAEEIRLSAGLQIDLFGENRMQELARNSAQGAYLDKPCHFIGHLQTNKVKKVVGQAAVIQSVGSCRLLQAIAREAEKQNLRQDILLEINIGGEERKAGVSPEGLWPLVEAALGQPQVRLRGLMAIPPAFNNSPDSRGWFARMRQLFDQAQGRYPEADLFDTLSMGMTDSFIAAIKEGATLIRVGTGIFGERP